MLDLARLKQNMDRLGEGTLIVVKGRYICRVGWPDSTDLAIIETNFNESLSNDVLVFITEYRVDGIARVNTIWTLVDVSESMYQPCEVICTMKSQMNEGRGTIEHLRDARLDKVRERFPIGTKVRTPDDRQGIVYAYHLNKSVLTKSLEDEWTVSLKDSMRVFIGNWSPDHLQIMPTHVCASCDAPIHDEVEYLCEECR